MTPGPPPQPHGWVRLGFEVSRFPDFREGGLAVLSYLGVWSLGLFSPTFFSTSSKKKNVPQPHGWVRLGFEVSRFPDFCEGGLACAELPRDVEFGAL